jgi:hypothetical protein
VSVDCTTEPPLIFVLCTVVRPASRSRAKPRRLARRERHEASSPTRACVRASVTSLGRHQPGVPRHWQRSPLFAVRSVAGLYPRGRQRDLRMLPPHGHHQLPWVQRGCFLRTVTISCTTYADTAAAGCAAPVIGSPALARHPARSAPSVCAVVSADSKTLTEFCELSSAWSVAATNVTRSFIGDASCQGMTGGFTFLPVV